jgi:hypothetical protein
MKRKKRLENQICLIWPFNLFVLLLLLLLLLNREGEALVVEVWYKLHPACMRLNLQISLILLYGNLRL